jgi:hypothetical protein
MKKSGVAALMLGTVLCWGMTAAASATDFYFVGSPDMGTIILLDPGTIAPAPDGHKIAHLAYVGSYSLWHDDKMELDCAGKRLRKLSSVSHLAGGGTIDNPEAKSSWGTPQKDSIAASVVTTVCQWPGIKPTGKAVLASPDFPTLIDRISAVITKNKEKK